ncbi:PilT-like protein [Desulfamplus magnetovallimortis]|uniref:PilT-like protein n=1 Tax=Desulfamplus magnetovallimortis TaxID=1246637 RepID=A0A1W1H7T0_9BACT|nr:type II toxin-antitoxin system VapC family toxin [Desulfamplus magnetovallimortis]SLM28428.1 PilT-like protein [Desulfamplus magnetovallimortis]
MKRYLLDTNICVKYLNGSRKKAEKRSITEQYIFEKINKIKDITDLYLSQAVDAELRFGAEKSQNRDKNLQRIEVFEEAFPVLKIDDDVWDYYVKLRTELSRVGKTIHDMELLIAATAIRYDLVLVSNDNDMNNLDFLTYEKVERESWVA